MILIECYADTVLLKALGFLPKHIKEGKSELLNQMEKNENMVGMVDEDPEASHHPYEKIFELIEHKDDIMVKFDKNKHNYIIILSPRLEDWIIKSANEAKVKMKNYSLSSKPDELHKQLRPKARKLENFGTLVEELKEKSKRVKNLSKILIKYI